MTLLSAVYPLFTAAAATLFGVPVSEISLYVGPKLLQTNAGTVSLTLRLLPIGSFVRFRHGEEAFDALHPLARCVVILAGPFALIVIAVILLGPGAAWSELLTGFRQVTLGALPAHRNLATAFFQLVRTAPLTQSAGLLAAKMAAFNLLPIPPLACGMAVTHLIRWRSEKRAFEEQFGMVGMVISLALLVGWIIKIAGAIT